jgi:hypothetical protein
MMALKRKITNQTACKNTHHKTGIYAALHSQRLSGNNDTALLRYNNSGFEVGHKACEGTGELDIHAVHPGVILASIKLATFGCRTCHTLLTAAQYPRQLKVS